MALTKKPNKFNQLYRDLRDAEKQNSRMTEKTRGFNSIPTTSKVESSDLGELERRLALRLKQGFFQVSDIFYTVGTLYSEDKTHIDRRRLQGKRTRNSEAIVKENYFVYVSKVKPLIEREYKVVNHS